MAGMLWPNIPVAVGAVGALVATYLPDNDESKLPMLMNQLIVILLLFLSLRHP